MSANKVFKPHPPGVALRLAVVALVYLLAWAPAAHGQLVPDPGEPTRLVFSDVPIVLGQSTPVPMMLFNDEAIDGIFFQMILRGPDTNFASTPQDFAIFDSVTFFPMPMDDPLMLDYRAIWYDNSVKYDGVDTLMVWARPSDPPHVPVPANFVHPVALLWFTGVRPGWIEPDLEKLANASLFLEGSSGIFHPTVECPERILVPDTATIPGPECGDRGTPDVLSVNETRETVPIGESTPLTVSFENDEPLHIINTTLRFYSADSGVVHYDSIRYLGRMADPSVCEFRTVADGWADGVLPDSIAVDAIDISGHPLDAGSGPIFEVFLSGVNAGEVRVVADTRMKPLCDDGSVDIWYYQYSVSPFNVTVGDPLPPVPTFQALEDPAPVVAGETVAFTVQASSPLGNKVDVNMFSFFLYDSLYGQAVSEPVFDDGSFTWTPDAADIGIWKASFMAVDQITGRSAETYAVIQVVSNDNYLVAFDCTERADALQANGIAHGDFDRDGSPEIMVTADPLVTGLSLALYDHVGSGLLQETYTLAEDYPNRGLVTGYINEDSYLDAVTCVFNEVWVLLGDGTGDFTVLDANVARPSGAFIDAVLTDYNGDAYLDYVCLSAPKIVTVYAGGPGASFTQACTFSASYAGLSLAATDVNADGRDDLIVGHSMGLDVYLNDGLGAYEMSYSYTQNLGTREIDINEQGSDFNGDGIFDFCVAAPGTGVNAWLSDMEIYLGHGDGSYDPVNIKVVYGTACGTRAGDFNGDGRMDVAFINSTERYLALLLADADGTFKNQIRFDIPKYQPAHLDCMDIDSDGDLDLVVASHDFSTTELRSSIFVFRNGLNPGGMVSASMRVAAIDNVDIEVLASNGTRLDKVSSTMPSASLYRRNLNGNARIDYLVSAQTVASGSVALNVAPRPDAAGGGTFSLNYSYGTSGVYRIARNLPVPPENYVFPIFPDGQSRVRPHQGECLRIEHPTLEWDSAGGPPIDEQSSLPFSDSPCDFRIATDPNFANVIESGTVNNNRYSLQTSLDVQDTVSYFWQIRPEGQSDWGGIYVFHALPLNHNEKDPTGTDSDDDIGGDIAGGAGGGTGSGAGGDTEQQPTGVDETSADETLPLGFELRQNQPNPFNPTTVVSYSLPRGGQVKLQIYNVLGNLVATLVDEYQPAGRYSATWDAGNFASGIYLYRLSTDETSATRKMILVK